jgi:hypothetical protein
MVDLRYFYADFNIVADMKKFKEFQKKVSNSSFDNIRERIKFISYDKLSDYHSKAFMYFQLNKELKI